MILLFICLIRELLLIALVRQTVFQETTELFMFCIGRRYSATAFILPDHFGKLKDDLYESLWTVTSFRAFARLIHVNFLKNMYKQKTIY